VFLRPRAVAENAHKQKTKQGLRRDQDLVPNQAPVPCFSCRATPCCSVRLLSFACLPCGRVYRSITDRSRVLLASFCEHDIAKVVNNLSKKHSKDKRVNRIRNGISDFLQSVCDDLVELYPNILEDSDFVLRLLKRLLEKSASKANGDAAAVADTVETEA